APAGFFLGAALGFPGELFTGAFVGLVAGVRLIVLAITLALRALFFALLVRISPGILPLLHIFTSFSVQLAFAITAALTLSSLALPFLRGIALRTAIALFRVFLLTFSGLLFQTLKRARSFTEKSPAFLLFFAASPPVPGLCESAFASPAPQHSGPGVSLRGCADHRPILTEAASGPFFSRAR